jgi:hypothetical protein
MSRETEPSLGLQSLANIVFFYLDSQAVKSLKDIVKLMVLSLKMFFNILAFIEFISNGCCHLTLV